MKRFLLPLFLLIVLAAPAQAQRKNKHKGKNDAPLTSASRLQPLFGGATPAQAEQLVGKAFLDDVGRNFASRAEASTFFANKGFEYLSENQPDTAAYRFNLAWLLDPRNASAYRGLAVVASSQPTPDQSIDLLTQGLALAPTDYLLLTDMGSSYMMRYEQTKKKKDLTTGMDYLQKSLAANAANANAWQQMARAYYLQEDYPKAWDAVHQGQKYSVASIDFGLITELLAKAPDPLGTFK